MECHTLPVLSLSVSLVEAQSLLPGIVVRTELRDVGEHVLCILELKRIILYYFPRKAAMVPKAGTPVWRSPGPE